MLKKNGVIKMTYNQLVKALQDALNEEGIRLSQDKLKKIFETMSNVIIDNIGEEETIKIKEFLIFNLIEIKPRKLPDGKYSSQQYSMQIQMTDKYKRRIKNKLNNK